MNSVTNRTTRPNTHMHTKKKTYATDINTLAGVRMNKSVDLEANFLSYITLQLNLIEVRYG